MKLFFGTTFFGRATKRALVATSALAALAPVYVGSSFAAGTSGVSLAPHRAVYDVKLKDASDRSGITAMDGRIVYEFQGTACDGYTTNFRFVTRIGANGEAQISDQRTTTYEAPDGGSFRFVTKTYVNDNFDREVSGTAVAKDDALAVELTKPDEGSITLGPAMFPAKHMLDLLTRAKAGETFYEQAIFDGSEDGDQVMTTTVIIGPEKESDEGDIVKELTGQKWRKVNITYFDEISEGEDLPEYGVSFKMYDNGVTRSLHMDYGDFALEGALADFELLENPKCE